MRAMVTCPTRPIVTKVSSHRSAQGVMLAEMIRETGEFARVDINWGGEIADHDAYDVVFMYHGNDMDDAINLYGGMEAWPYEDNVANFWRTRAEVRSLERASPDYAGYFKSKLAACQAKGQTIQPCWLGIDPANAERITRAPVVAHPAVHPRLVVGDSHAICMYRPGWMVRSIKYKTLHGALKIGLANMVREIEESEDVYMERTEFYFGNIDIRHHLCRQPDPIAAARQLADDYSAQLATVSDFAKAKAYEPLPIENESRKVPQSGFYMKTPFFGSWQQRVDIRGEFIRQLEKHSSVIRWTDRLLNMSGELDFAYMEKPRSVHLSREHYPHWQGDRPDLERKAVKDTAPKKENESIERFFT